MLTLCKHILNADCLEKLIEQKMNVDILILIISKVV